MTPRGWPFLVSCNHRLDYTAVAVPEFIRDSGRDRHLARVAGGGVSNRGEAYVRLLQSVDQTLALVFQVVPARHSDLLLDGPDPVRDPFGRRVDLVEGFVLEQQDWADFITPSELARAHEVLLPDFRTFWSYPEKDWTVRITRPLALGEQGSSQGLRLVTQPPARIPAGVEPRQAPTRQPPTVPPRADHRYIAAYQIQADGDRILRLAVSSNGSRVAVFTASRRVAVYECASGRLAAEALTDGSADPALPLFFHPTDPSCVVTAIRDAAGGHRVVALGSAGFEHSEPQVLAHSGEKPTALAIDPDGCRLYQSSAASVRAQWLSDGSWMRSLKQFLDFRDTLPTPHEPRAILALREPRTSLIVGDRQGTISAIDDGFRWNFAHANAHQGAITCLAAHPGWRRMASGGADGVVRIWSYPHLQPVTQYDRFESAPCQLAFVSSSSWAKHPPLLVAEANGRVTLIEARPSSLAPHAAEVLIPARREHTTGFSHNGHWIVTATGSGPVTILRRVAAGVEAVPRS
jgi:WD40 repeat protein